MLFSDGALAWPAECEVLKLKNISVRHGRQQFARKIRKQKAGGVTTAGTQVLDRWWQGLDEFVPSQLHNKSDHGENPMLRRYAYAYLWRYHIRNRTNLLDAFGDIL